VPLFASNGEVFGVLGVYEDITVLKEKEDRCGPLFRKKR